MEQENNAGGTVETPSVEDLQERLAKAEAKIVKLKSTTKEVEASSGTTTEEQKVETFSADDFDKKYEERKFYETNPDMVEFKEAISGYTSKGLSFDDAKSLVEQKDETYLNRQKAKQINFTDWEPSSDTTSYTQDQVASMPFDQRKKVMSKVISWKAKMI